MKTKLLSASFVFIGCMIYVVASCPRQPEKIEVVKFEEIQPAVVMSQPVMQVKELVKEEVAEPVKTNRWNITLTDDEIDMLNRLTVLFLDSAELRVKERKDLTLNYWRENVDALLNFQNKDVLKNAGSISSKQMESIVDAVYEDFNNRRKLYAINKADKDDDELMDLEDDVRNRKL